MAVLGARGDVVNIEEAEVGRVQAAFGTIPSKVIGGFVSESIELPYALGVSLGK